MLKITGNENEVNVVGEIFNSVLELFGGDSYCDGFGCEKKEKSTQNVNLSNANEDSLYDNLVLIRDAIRLSYKNKGVFSQKENYLADFRNRR